MEGWIHDFLCRTVSILPFSLLRPDAAKLLPSACPGTRSEDTSCLRRHVSLYRSVMSLSMQNTWSVNMLARTFIHFLNL